ALQGRGKAPRGTGSLLMLHRTLGRNLKTQLPEPRTAGHMRFHNLGHVDGVEDGTLMISEHGALVVGIGHSRFGTDARGKKITWMEIEARDLTDQELVLAAKAYPRLVAPLAQHVENGTATVYANFAPLGANPDPEK